jgi:hypothetical protein
MTRERQGSDRPVDKSSGVRRNVRDCVLLVHVDPDDEAETLGLDELAVRILRVRHPLPACERIRVVRPLAVVIGHGVRGLDLDLVRDAAHEVGGEIVELEAVARSALREEVRRAVDRASKRKPQDAHDDAPDTERVPRAGAR